MKVMPLKRSAFEALDINDSKDDSPDDGYDSPSAQSRLDPEAAAEFAASSKKRATGAAPRTGQACDRCKNRKIRCDDTKGGCLPCRQNNTECRTTDRITQRATVRGHTEAIEHDNTILKHQIYELEQQLRDHAIEPKQSTAYVAISSATTTPAWSTPAPTTWPVNRTSVGTTSSADARQQEANFFALPTFRAGLTGDNYLGVSSSSTILSQVKGTSLSVFGIEVDLADYISDDKSTSPVSYESFLASMAKDNPAYKDSKYPRLPTYENCQMYANVYVTLLNPWTPVVHKTAFIELAQKTYQPDFRPTVAETVMVQMMLAHVKYQISHRNSDGSLYFKTIAEESFAHYHYSVSRVFELVTNRTLPDVQAIAMICAYMRGFAKPGAAWMFSIWALGMAVEMGLHRSTKVWPNENGRSLMDIEMRKRVFWTLMMIHVLVSGKLGRPCSIRSEDYDVEFPQALDDTMPSELASGQAPSCSFRSAIEIFKMVELDLDTYNTIYAIRSSTPYEEDLRRLEAKAEKWEKDLPAEFDLSRVENADGPQRMIAVWLSFMKSSYALNLHHPAVCRSTSKEVASRNLDICTDAAFAIIETSAELRKLNCLDTTWIHATTYLAAIFTLLFVHWERRDTITTHDLTKLKVQLGLCLEIMGDVGVLLGTGHRLRDTIHSITNSGLAHIHRYMTEKTASAAVATSELKTKTKTPAAPASVKRQRIKSETPIRHNSVQMGFVNPPNPQVHAYQDVNVVQPSYGVSGSTDVTHVQQFNGYQNSSADYSLAEHDLNAQQAYMNQQTTNAYLYNAAQASQFGVPNAWHKWTESMKGHTDAPEFFNSASALMALGGRDPNHGDQGVDDGLNSGMVTTTVSMSNSAHANMNALMGVPSWPRAAGYDYQPMGGLQ